MPLLRRHLLNSRTLKSLRDNKVAQPKARGKPSLESWSKVTISYITKVLAPLPLYREVRPSYGFLKRHNLPLKCLDIGKTRDSKLRFYLVHFIYFVKKHMKVEWDKLNLDLRALSVNLLLGRVHFYFRLLQKVLGKDIEEKLEAIQLAPNQSSGGIPHPSPCKDREYNISSLKDRTRVEEAERLLFLSKRIR